MSDDKRVGGRDEYSMGRKTGVDLRELSKFKEEATQKRKEIGEVVYDPVNFTFTHIPYAPLPPMKRQRK